MLTDPHALDQYNEILGDDARDVIIDILETFLEDAPNQLQSLDDSMEAGDSIKFCRAAHTMKSTCKTIGAIGLGDQFLLLEQAGESGDLSNVKSIVMEVKEQYRDLAAEVSDKISTLKNS